ncbi:hypothetical protein [Halorarum salinum]|nr:hypothetical protein [Halobaculum salinum]
MTRVTDVDLYGVPNEESLNDATQSFDELELIVGGSGALLTTP